MTISLDFLSENCASRGAKTDFLSFAVQELLTFEFVVSNRSPSGPLIEKFCLVRIGLKQRIIAVHDIECFYMFTT